MPRVPQPRTVRVMGFEDDMGESEDLAERFKVVSRVEVVMLLSSSSSSNSNQSS